MGHVTQVEYQEAKCRNLKSSVTGCTTVAHRPPQHPKGWGYNFPHGKTKIITIWVYFLMEKRKKEEEEEDFLMKHAESCGRK